MTTDPTPEDPRGIGLGHLSAETTPAGIPLPTEPAGIPAPAHPWKRQLQVIIGQHAGPVIELMPLLVRAIIDIEGAVRGQQPPKH